MEIMVTLPAAKAECEALHVRASQLHAEAIRGILEAQSGPEREKTAQLQQLIRQIKEKSGAAQGNREPEMTKL